MAETETKKTVCQACGSERRPDTQFCYNCGKPTPDANSIFVTEPPVNGSEGPIPKPELSEIDAELERLFDPENAPVKDKIANAALHGFYNKVDASPRRHGNHGQGFVYRSNA